MFTRWQHNKAKSIVKRQDAQHGFVMFAVIGVFLILIVLSSLVLRQWGQVSEKMILKMNYHQLQQVALSSMEIYKVELAKDPTLCGKPFDQHHTFLNKPGFVIEFECLKTNARVYDLRVSAVSDVGTTFPLHVIYDYTFHR